VDHRPLEGFADQVDKRLAPESSDLRSAITATLSLTIIKLLEVRDIRMNVAIDRTLFLGFLATMSGCGEG
jgi:hypothetical protein